MGPTLVVLDQVRIDAIYSFHQITFDEKNHYCYGYPSDSNSKEENKSRYTRENKIATIPVAALEQYLIINGQINKYIESVQSKTGVVTKMTIVTISLIFEKK